MPLCPWIATAQARGERQVHGSVNLLLTSKSPVVNPGTVHLVILPGTPNDADFINWKSSFGNPGTTHLIILSGTSNSAHFIDRKSSFDVPGTIHLLILPGTSNDVGFIVWEAQFGNPGTIHVLSNPSCPWVAVAQARGERQVLFCNDKVSFLFL